MREKLIELLNGVLTTEDVTSSEEVADHLIANGVTVTDNNVGGKWISVKERLPSVWMTYIEDGYSEPMEFIVFIKNAELPTVKYFNGKNFCDDYGYIYVVTHWMPLPEPPKGE